MVPLPVAETPRRPSRCPYRAGARGVATSGGSPKPRETLATRALWTCACVTEHDAPSWLIYDVADSGLIWCRVPDSQEPLDLVDARFTAGGHADPAEVLRWLHCEASEPWGRLVDGGGDSSVLEGLRKRIAAQ